MPKVVRLCFITSIFAMTALVGYSSRKCSAADPDVENLATFELIFIAGAANAAGEIEDAGFLFYAAQARYQIDKQVYPPVGMSGDDLGSLKAALGFSVGKPIVSAVTGDPTAYANVIARLSEWSPKFEPDYDPGWEYKNALNQEAAAKIVVATCEAMLAPLRQKAKLLDQKEYRLLTKVVGEARAVEQRYWAALEANRGVEPVPGNLKEEFQTAISKKKVAARRMNEIEWELNPDSRWHKVVKWKAEEYFNDPQAIKLCHAIETNDVEEMNRLIAAGADVNATGKAGMTLLLWAFPDRKLERFECLLKHGADPNVFIESDFNVGSRPFHPYPENRNFFEDRGCHAGQSVTHLACRSPVIKYMQLVFAHGGDANLVNKKTKVVPLGIALRTFMPEKPIRVEILIKNNANPNPIGYYPAIQAVKRHEYDTARFLLQSGANPSLTPLRDSRTLVHWVLMHEEHLPFPDTKRDFEYRSLVDWLLEHDAPFDEARADLDRKGRLWGKALKKKREKELAEGKALGKIWAQKRVEKLKAIKLADLETPETTEDFVKALSDLQLMRLELPADLNTQVFVMYQTLPKRISSKQQRPWITVFADRRVVCPSFISPTAEPVKASISQAELTWLLHLAVNECGILEKRTAFYERKKRPTGKGFFNYQLSVKYGSNQLQLPQDTLVIRSLRRKLKLDKFKGLHTFIRDLVNRAHLGNQSEVTKVIDAINAALQKQHPDLPLFQLHHLAYADRGDNSRFTCSFERKINLGDKQFEEVTAVYVLDDRKPKVIINVRK